MKDILMQLAEIEHQIFVANNTLKTLQGAVHSILERIEQQEAQKLEVGLTPMQMFAKIHELINEEPLNMSNECGRVIVTFGSITTCGKNSDEAITKLYKILKHRGAL